VEQLELQRYWLITSTTYGTWLPGDDRAFVSNVRVDDQEHEVRHNRTGQEYDRNMRRLEEHARSNLGADPVILNRSQAQILVEQFQETCRIRQWQLFAVAVMRTHFHAVVGVTDDPDPEDILRDLKSYGSRAMNKRFGKPSAPRWWTESGSKRKLGTLEATIAAVRYVQQQPNPLIIWTADIPILRDLDAERGASAP
jgi:REP element-mobilizing transposase RayT